MSRKREFPSKWLGNGVVSYSTRIFQVDIDLHRGYWPLRASQTTGGTTFSVEIEIVELEGHWLPKSAKVNQPNGTQSRLEFIWNAINGQVDDSFDLGRLKQRYKIGTVKWQRQVIVELL